MSGLLPHPVFTVQSCIEPSPMPPTIRFPSWSHEHDVTGIRIGLASLGLMTCF
uniref:Uncharacterized protein n=1 Tax=Arundo donax TaxID=35708 RepID=A0A0A9E4K9_ARUDO